MGYIVEFRIESSISQIPLTFRDIHLTTGEIISSTVQPGEQIPLYSYVSIIIDNAKNNELSSKSLIHQLDEIVFSDKPFLIKEFSGCEYLVFELGSSTYYVIFHPATSDSYCLVHIIPSDETTPFCEGKFEWRDDHYNQIYYIFFKDAL